jgi:hypothetical protein
LGFPSGISIAKLHSILPEYLKGADLIAFECLSSKFNVKLHSIFLVHETNYHCDDDDEKGNEDGPSYVTVTKSLGLVEKLWVMVMARKTPHGRRRRRQKDSNSTFVRIVKSSSLDGWGNWIIQETRRQKTRLSILEVGCSSL